MDEILEERKRRNSPTLRMDKRKGLFKIPRQLNFNSSSNRETNNNKLKKKSLH